ncbi:hypothetical protein [Hymenobacter sp. BT730]|uniref:hypothetical protein n=1 Tax=Hymenobacter sp. BT730 TaxID=3063332 RepID=UPI0026DF32C5|nr:hypothetical protein [Hymenobacter sp. BT730]
MPDAKNDKFSPKTLLWLLPALLLLAAIRLHGLPQAAFPDYDSVRNWQIVQEVAQGNLRNIFHHASPGFYLLYAPVAALQPDFHWFLYLNALLAVAAVGRLAAFVARYAHLRGPEAALLALLIGTCTMLTFSGRDFTMSSASLLLFGELMRAYYERLQQPSRKALTRVAVWLAVGLCINYKFLLIFPILGAFEILQADGLLWQRGNAWRVMAILAAPFLVLGIVVTGLTILPWYRWLATYAGILWPSAMNEAGRTGNVRLDLWYYPRMLIQFESPLLWMGLLLTPVVFWQQLRAWRKELTLPIYLLVWAWLFMGGMSLILKAPRGLLFAYGLFAALGFLSLQQLLNTAIIQQRLSVPIRASILVVFSLLIIGGNLLRIQHYIYRYTATSYDQVAQWLQSHGQQQVASTVSNALLPFAAPAGISVQVISNDNQLPALQAAGVQYVVLDGYRLVTGINQFPSLEKLPAEAEFTEPLLLSPLLFLEHSEFTGLGYEETLLRREEALKRGTSLRIVRIPRL